MATNAWGSCQSHDPKREIENCPLTECPAPAVLLPAVFCLRTCDGASSCRYLFHRDKIWTNMLILRKPRLSVLLMTGSPAFYTVLKACRARRRSVEAVHRWKILGGAASNSLWANTCTFKNHAQSAAASTHIFCLKTGSPHATTLSAGSPGLSTMMTRLPMSHWMSLVWTQVMCRQHWISISTWPRTPVPTLHPIGAAQFESTSAKPIRVSFYSKTLRSAEKRDTLYKVVEVREAMYLHILGTSNVLKSQLAVQFAGFHQVSCYSDGTLICAIKTMGIKVPK